MILTLEIVNWDPLYLFHSVYSNLLIDIANTFDLYFLYSTNFVSTRCSNSVIDLMFLRPNSLEFDSHIY